MAGRRKSLIVVASDDPRQELQRLRVSGDSGAAVELARECGVPNRMLPNHPEGSQLWWDRLSYLLDMELQLRGR